MKYIFLKIKKAFAKFAKAVWINYRPAAASSFAV